MLESELKKKCRLLLEKAGWYVVHIIQSNKNGIPDTVAIRRGETVWIEFKAPGKKIDTEGLQAYRKKELQAHGATHIECSLISHISHLIK